MISRGWCAIIIYAFLWKLSYPGVAQIGSALEWGSRGRRFDSCHSDQTCGRQFITNCRPLFTMWFDLKRNFLNHLNIVIADFVLSSMAFLYVIGDPRRFLREDSGAGRSLALAQPGNVPVSASPPESGEPCCRRQAQPNKRPASVRQVHQAIFVSRGMQRLPETIQPAGPGKLLKKMQEYELERPSAAPVPFTNRGQAGILHP